MGPSAARGRTRDPWILVAACGLACAVAAAAGRGDGPSVAGVPAPGPAFVQVRGADGGAAVVALPPGFLAMLDGRSFGPGPAGGAVAGWMDGASAVALGVPVRLNAASADDIAAIPGVSRRVAAAIVAARATDGPFASWDDVDAVRGVGAKTLAALRRAAAP